MHFIVSVIKALATVSFMMLILYWLKIPTGSAKYEVVLSLAGSGAIFFFLHKHMEFIGFFEAPITGLNKNITPALVWKMLGIICGLIIMACLIFWESNEI